jgi:hypothetical protein
VEVLSDGAETSAPNHVLIQLTLASDDMEGLVERAVAAGATVASALKTPDLPGQPTRSRGHNAVIKS